MNKLKASTVSIKSLKTKEIQAMYSLFDLYYENTSFDKFNQDLALKDRVIILRDKKTKKICGFSTIKIFKVYIDGKEVRALFSGDTIIDGNYWGQTALTMEFFKNVLFEKFKAPHKHFYWYLISKGFKTYLLLTNNFKNFAPSFTHINTDFENKLIDAFAKELHSPFYNSSTQTLKFDDSCDRLKKEVAPITDKNRLNPHIKFFEKVNPNWSEGEELCCIGRVDIGLITKYLSRTYYKRIKK